MTSKCLTPLVMICLVIKQTRAYDVRSITIRNENSATQQRITKTVNELESNLCQILKKGMRVQYDQLQDDKEPDLNDLALEYIISDEESVSYNLSSAAQTIPEACGFRPDQPLVIFFLGFTAGPYGPAFTRVRKAFNKAGNHHVLALDASPVTGSLFIRAATYVRLIGEKLGEVLAAMIKAGFRPSLMHMVGHSLGAHTAGFTGKSFYNTTGVLLGRVTGLDPSLLCFSNLPDEMRLSEHDAEFVDIMHTNAGAYGLDQSIGHVDYCVNGGSEQPGCSNDSCSHSRAWELFSESVVNPTAFIGVKCTDMDAYNEGKCSNETSIMGYSCQPGTRGVYFLRTNGSSPYGLGEEGIQCVDNSVD